MIVKKELVVANRKKVDIISDLRKKNFRPFPKVAKAKASGETEDVEEEAEDENTGTSDPFQIESATIDEYGCICPVIDVLI